MIRALVLLAVGVTVGVAAAVLSWNPPLPPCPTEDSVNCYWDADVQGNGFGHDVVNGGD